MIPAPFRWAVVTVFMALLCLGPMGVDLPGGGAAAAALQVAPITDAETTGYLPLDELSPSFLGMYRKLMLIEDEIRRQCERYHVDFDLARAVCLYESGGDSDLTSTAGARGYFQVMPATLRLLRVPSNIEAGVKYLSQMIRRFEREDYAVAAYNAGPTRIARSRPMPLETLQYVFGVGQFRMVLKMHEASVRHHAQRIKLALVDPGDDWWTISQRLGISMVELRLHNPFLAARPLRAGALVAHPPEPRADLVTAAEQGPTYRVRYGDNYLHLAFSLGIDLDALRGANGLWHLQSVPPGMRLRIPVNPGGSTIPYLVRGTETLGEIARATGTDPWRIIRENGLFVREEVVDGMILRIPPVAPARAVTSVARTAAEVPVGAQEALMHRVQRGETLSGLARRYATTVRAIQQLNGGMRGTTIRVGDVLRIPLPNTTSTGTEPASR